MGPVTAETTSWWRWLSLLVALAGNLVGALVASIIEMVRWLIAIVRPELTLKTSSSERLS